MRDNIQRTRTTARWVRTALAGDPEAFNRLFARVAVRAWMHLQNRLKASPALQTDPFLVIQDARRAAYRAFRRTRYTGQDAFLRWICRVVDHRLDEVAVRKQDTL